MDQQEKAALVGLFQEAQQMVEAGLGQSLSGSVVRDQVLVSLIGFMINDYFTRRQPGAGQGLAFELSQGLEKAMAPVLKLALQQQPREPQPREPEHVSLAVRLLQATLSALPAQWPGAPQQPSEQDLRRWLWEDLRQWVWETFQFFLERLPGLLAGRGKRKPEAQSGPS